jgi:hypothetical protein
VHCLKKNIAKKTLLVEFRQWCFLPLPFTSLSKLCTVKSGAEIISKFQAWRFNYKKNALCQVRKRKKTHMIFFHTVRFQTLTLLVK